MPHCDGEKEAAIPLAEALHVWGLSFPEDSCLEAFQTHFAPALLRAQAAASLCYACVYLSC